MKKFLSQIVVCALLLISFTRTANADTIGDLKIIANKVAGMDGASTTLVDYIITQESGYVATSTGDMDITCKRTGKPVRAKGIFQITDCWFPQISDEQAYDPIWSMDWAIPFIANKKTCEMLWTTCRVYYGDK